MSELIKRLRDHDIERIAFDRGVTADEINAFVHAIASLGARGGSEHSFNFPHIHVGRITADEKRDDGIGSDMAAIRQLYSNAVAAAESAWESRHRRHAGHAGGAAGRGRPGRGGHAEPRSSR